MHPALAHLSSERLQAFGQEIELIRQRVMDSRGAEDAAYIRGVVRLQRRTVALGRLLIYASLAFLPGVIPALSNIIVYAVLICLGVLVLASGKILENMELGHNIMHGQWDWMRDPTINSVSWEWDTSTPSDHWKQTHNYEHHTWTNVLGKDEDIGYGMLRIFPAQRWHPRYLAQPFSHLLLMVFFDWFASLHILGLDRIVYGKRRFAEVKPEAMAIARKVARLGLKEYVAYPLLAGPFFLHVAAANFAACTLRSLWTNIIIFCGHFPGGVHLFSEQDTVGESRSHWYARQMLGSCNLTGSPLFHLMTGYLSHQIEHHLFPDLPSRRYAEVAPEVEEVAKRYGLPYNKGSLWRQYGTTTLRIWRMALP